MGTLTVLTLSLQSGHSPFKSVLSALRRAFITAMARNHFRGYKPFEGERDFPIDAQLQYIPLILPTKTNQIVHPHFVSSTGTPPFLWSKSCFVEKQHLQPPVPHAFTVPTLSPYEWEVSPFESLFPCYFFFVLNCQLSNREATLCTGVITKSLQWQCSLHMHTSRAHVTLIKIAGVFLYIFHSIWENRHII